VAAVVAGFILVAPWFAPASALAQQSRLRVTPDIVRMNTFYGGATLRVEGAVAAGGKIIVIVRGPKVTETFNQAGRVGPIWVNTGKVTISEVPSLFLVFSSEPLSACLPRAVIDQYGLNLLAVKKQMLMVCKGRDCGRVADDYIAYKGTQGSYRLASGGFRMTQTDPAGASSASYALDFKLPRCATPGQYEVCAYECRGGQIVATSEAPLTVIEVGFPASVAGLASQHASFYGIISVLVTLLAGFGIDLASVRLFKRKIAGH
jgi:uncharacterized protein (TIGR02186 family)